LEQQEAILSTMAGQCQQLINKALTVLS
jgi:hypothetical protein